MRHDQKALGIGPLKKTYLILFGQYPVPSRPRLVQTAGQVTAFSDCWSHFDPLHCALHSFDMVSKLLHGANTKFSFQLTQMAQESHFSKPEGSTSL